MIKAVLMRVGHAVLSLLVLLVIVFSLVRLTGDPIHYLLPPERTVEQEENLRQYLGLDKPYIVQFYDYLGRLATGDLGESFRMRVPVTQMIVQRLPATLTMGAAALFLTLLIGLPLGIYSAYWRGGILDRFTRFIAAIGQSIPSFWLGYMLILVLAVNLQWLPSGGYGHLSNLVLPAITLSFASIAGLVRLLRSSMIEVMNSDYIKFHRMKGLPEHVILWKHALRNAGLTAMSFVGVVVAGLFTGSVLVETVFVWPGVGRLMIEGVGWRDFNVVQGVMILFSAAYIGANLLVDLLYIVLNPRLR
jgi:ABC-type dipeptide/oligopeptide/nickel transport system permease component